MTTPERFVNLTPIRRRAIRDGLLLSGFIFNVVLVVVWGPRLFLWIDARTWAAIDLGNLYRGAELGADRAFLYSPAVAWLMAPLSWLSWPALIGVLTALNLAAVGIMGRRYAPLLIVAFPPVLLELLNGNIQLFMALAIWAGLRWPAAWAFILLTKVTPGIGIAWFIARREWRNVAIALGATGLVVVLGALIAPQLWLDWFGTLVRASGTPATSSVVPLPVRLPIAILLAWYAGRTDRAWLVPVAGLVAMPVIWLQSTALLTACFPLWWDRAHWVRAGTPADRRGSATAASPSSDRPVAQLP
ncbi:MAG TPA: glycosyltransferase family 87 protein [Candidatus Eisenbacteria bacterium]|nr:glycosyltransferase family 87 protein [Candidatus Eisenbacteria bacterium]